jgi:hypothetical protein
MEGAKSPKPGLSATFCFRSLRKKSICIGGLNPQVLFSHASIIKIMMTGYMCGNFITYYRELCLTDIFTFIISFYLHSSTKKCVPVTFLLTSHRFPLSFCFLQYWGLNLGFTP